MRVAVTNKSPAPQGVRTLDGIVWIKPGDTRTISIENIRHLERLPFLEVAHRAPDGTPLGDVPAIPDALRAKIVKFDHDGDGKPGGSAKQPDTDDMKALRAEYQAKMGKRAFPGWDAATIRAKMAG